MKKTATITPLLGISQQYMAMLLKVTRSQWSMYELGKRDLSLEAKRLLAEMIGFFMCCNSLRKIIGLEVHF